MKKFIVPVFVAVAALVSTQAVFAAGTAAAKPMSAQQSKFATCAHKSKGMKGAAHKKFMHDCLKGKGGGTPAKPAAKNDKGSKGGSK